MSPSFISPLQSFEKVALNPRLLLKVGLVSVTVYGPGAIETLVHDWTREIQWKGYDCTCLYGFNILKDFIIFWTTGRYIGYLSESAV